MAKLTTKQRKKLPASDFAGPDRSFPINDKSHAQNALARASQQRNKGAMSKAEYDKIHAAAEKKLKGKGK